MTNKPEIQNNKSGKTVRESEAETTLAMLPSDANPLGNVFGGIILKHVDLTAGLVAKILQVMQNIVTASMDSMTFLKPVYIGNALILKARINYVKRSSMEVQVDIEGEHSNKSQKIHTGTAYVTLVALDEKGKPVEVPKLDLQNKEEQDRYFEGENRMELRLEPGKRKKLIKRFCFHP